MRCTSWLALLAVMLGFALPATSWARPRGWPRAVKEVHFPSPADGTDQPALFYAAPRKKGPRPLLVALHTWSRDHRNVDGAPYARWCIRQGWNLIHPNFRGPNNGPHAAGSEAAIDDVLAAIAYAREHADVDPARIYLVGYSGGGHMSLMVAARAPELFAGVSAWVPVTDLAAWYFQTRGTVHDRYAHDIRRACGGIPYVGTPAEAECKRRSPLTHLRALRGVPVDLNTGIHDGHDGGSVPVSHAIAAYNLLAKRKARIGPRLTRTLVHDERVPRRLRYRGRDRLYAGVPVLLRRHSGPVRLTIFDGAHTMRRTAALSWLAHQRKRVDTRQAAR